MRMGQGKIKGKKSQQKKRVFETLESSKKGIIVGGKISSNLIESIYQEKLTHIANDQAEKHAQDLLEVEDELESNETNIPEKNSSESYLFASTEAREEFLTLLSETSSHFSNIGKSVPKWKVHANAAKFERQLNEKYGRLRPFITKYPQIETNLRSIQRKYSRGEFSPFRQGPAPIDKKASIILLVIMQRNGVKMEKIFLTALFFLVGLQPWALVLLVTIGHFMFEKRKKKKISGWVGGNVKPVQPYYADAIKAESEDEQSIAKAKHDKLLEPVGKLISPKDFNKNEEEGTETYDTLVVGSGPTTLYTASLLARSGRTVLVLSPDNDASGCRSLNISSEKKQNDRIAKYANVPFDIQSNNIAHTSAQQQILAPALCSETDTQGGIRFAQIGSESDGFTSEILSIPGMGVDNYKDNIPYLIRGGGISSIAEDAASFLGDAWPNEDGFGDSSSAAYLSLCAGINVSAKEFYMTKLLSKKVNEMKNATTYQEASIRYASGFLDKGLPFNPHVRSLMAGIGMRGENIPPSKTSMAAHVTNINACLSQEGFTYPVGGPRALCHALATVIEQNGGKVVTGAKVKEFLFDQNVEEEENETEQDGTAIEKPRCYGVKLDDDRIVSVGTNEESCVVSMLGFIETFVFKMADNVRTQHGLPVGLPALTERRPLLKILFCLNGNSDELNLTGADWYRLPNASLPFDEKNPETGEVTPGHIGQYDNEDDGKGNSDTGINENNEEDDGNESRGKRTKYQNSSKKKNRRVEFVSGSSWMKVSFPSAKDPSWRERHNGISTCVVTIEATSSFVRMFDTLPKVYSAIKFSPTEVSVLIDKVSRDLIDNFPQLKEKIELCEMIGPLREGLSHDPQRFAAKGICPKTPYPGLFVGGSDLTVGDSFSASIVGGWIASNAVIGYSFLDHLLLEKNITNDISQFLNTRNMNGNDEDVAVPFSDSSISESCDQSDKCKDE